MNKIPTLFLRDWSHPKKLVTSAVSPGCEWVIAGEGIATRKLNGTCCLVRDGRLYKRRELNNNFVKLPDGFELVATDQETGKRFGWAPVGEGPGDRWHIEAFGDLLDPLNPDPPVDGDTFELLGPKVQGNPEKINRHVLLPHRSAEKFPDAPRDFSGLRAWLAPLDIEGIVFHHPDGRMAKIKKRDFGIR